jgi:hypothetical protein
MPKNDIKLENYMKKIFVICTFFLLYSCANLNSLQDGKTLEKGTFEITPIMSVGYYKSNVLDDNNVDEPELDILPTIGLRAKYGISERFDAGINADLSTNFGFTGKYQFLQSANKKLNSSIGADFGTNLLSILNNEDTFYYYSVPLYISYNHNEAVCTFVVPRFINKSEYVYTNKYDAERSVGEKYSLSKFNVAYGMLFGKKNTYGFEISHNSSKTLMPTEISFGYNYRF